MDWLKTILYGFIAGLTELLPVSSQAHRMLASLLLGVDGHVPLLRMLIRVACFAALLVCCGGEIRKIRRETRLAKVPARRRTRPLDLKSVNTMRLLKVAGVPLVLGMLLYGKTDPMVQSLHLLVLFLGINGVLLFVPHLLKTGNKDSRMLSPFDGILIGLSGALGVIPGMSCMGAMLSTASMRGVDKGYALSFALLLQLPVMAVIFVFEAIALRTGVEMISLMVLLKYALTMAAAYLGCTAAVSVMRALAAKAGFSGFAYYCWGAALFTLILYLTT